MSNCLQNQEEEVELPPPPELPKEETAWERGLRQAKEVIDNSFKQNLRNTTPNKNFKTKVASLQP
jgi:hypothetical protein